MAKLSTAERNKRKRERRKARRKQEEVAVVDAQDKAGQTEPDSSAEVEIEYVAEPIIFSDQVEGLRKFQELVAVLGNEGGGQENATAAAAVKKDDEEEDDDRKAMSKRKLREMLRPSVADLKRKVARPELVEAHDVTAADPEFLIELKSVPGTVRVPRNWGRKRKYLQGKVRLGCLLCCCACCVFMC